MRLLIALLLISIPQITLAGRGVTTPYVTKDKFSITSDGFYKFNEGESSNATTRARLSFDAGITGRFAGRIRTTYENTGTTPFQFEKIEFVGKYEFAEKNELPVDLGLYLAAVSDIKPDTEHSIQTRFLFAKTTENWLHAANIIFEKDLDKDYSEMEMSIRFTNMYDLDTSNSIGIEYFGDFGAIDNLDDYDQEKHFFGPHYTRKIAGTGIKAEFGTLLGITDPTEDFTFKWKFTYGF